MWAMTQYVNSILEIAALEAVARLTDPVPPFVIERR